MPRFTKYKPQALCIAPCLGVAGTGRDPRTEILLQLRIVGLLLQRDEPMKSLFAGVSVVLVRFDRVSPG